LYVDGSVSESGDGASWATAFKRIQEGIDAASSGDTVIVAQETYLENILFKGKNIVLRSTDPLDASVVAGTIIDGNESGSVVTFSGSEAATCVLSGFTIRNGKADYGAGIFGGFSQNAPKAAIKNNVITGNSANANGGAVYWCDGTIEDNRILGNSAQNGAGLSGCAGTIQNNLIVNNRCLGWGGGVHWCSGTIQNNLIAGNSAGQAGGMYSCNNTIQNNVIVGNSAGYGGGLNHCGATVRNNAIIGNSAEWAGGGLCDCGGKIANNTIVANAATSDSGSGGGLWLCSGTIVNCIIWDNTAHEDAQLSLSSVPSYSCIQNWTGGGENNISQNPLFTGQPMSTGNWTGDGTFDPVTCQTTLVKSNASWQADALIGLAINPDVAQPLQFIIASNSATTIKLWGDASGFVRTGDTYEVYNYRLSAASPCIDSGKNEDWMSGAVDLDGNPRVIWGISSLTVDMGAYEAGDSAPPVITLMGANPVTLQVGTPYTEPGYMASDNCDGDVTARVVVSGSVNHAVVGSYTLHYNVSDSAGNAAEEKTRTVNVVDTTRPVITLLGQNPMTLQLGTPYVEPGYTATDNYDGNITANVAVSGSVNHTAVGSYTLRYNVSDSSGNPAQEKTRTVSVVTDTVPPVITLLGSNPMTIAVGTPYVEPGYTANDNRDGDITARVIVSGSVSHTVVGSYTLRYNVSDAAGNPAQERTRTVNVVDTVPPVITLLGSNVMTVQVGSPYAEPGYTATDNYDGNITAWVVVSGSVNHNVVGSYILRYTVSDSSGNPAQEKTRTVNVVDTVPPVITLFGDNPMTLQVGSPYAEPGYTASDNYDGNITASVVVTPPEGGVNYEVVGSYTLRYNVSDSSGNSAQERTRTVNVVDTVRPVITLFGDNPLTLEAGTPYEEPGYAAADNCDGDITANVKVTGSVDHTFLGSFALKYNVKDSSGNPAQEKTRVVNVVDTTPPVITLLGDNPMTLEVGTPYVEPGFTAMDNCDGDITADVVITGSVNHSVPGSYTLRYNVSDWSGNPAEEKTRTVKVVDTTPPVITLLGDDSLALEVGTPYAEPGYSASDNHDGDVTSKVAVSGSVDHSVLGIYVLRYNVSDSSGNPAEEKTRTITVADTTPPIIALLGEASVALDLGTPYTEPGYSANDNYDGDITGRVLAAGSVDHTVVGTYVLRYNVSDSSGNPAAEKTRTVNIVDTTPPVITLLGDDPVTLEVGTPYTEPGYSANDNYDGDITSNVAITGSVDHTVVGTYVLRYNLSDSSGNPAEEKTRTVNVVDTTSPVITLLGDDPIALEVGTPYTEPGYSANDNYDGDVTSNVAITGSVDHTVVGTYVLRYNVSDSSGNPAEEKTRTINVVSTDSVSILEIIQTADGSVQLVWKSSPGATYAIWSCSELATGMWNEEASVTSYDVLTTWTDGDAACLRKFYRIEAR
jgi:hypothetical protein